MSLETLLEAARYVELQEAQRLQHSGANPRDESRDGIRPGHRYHELIASPDFQKRAAGTREVHNKLEKNRRAHLKECFELLKRQLPPSSEEKKSSNLSILQIALRFIHSLRRKEREFEHEMERLAREKIAHQQRLTALKRDLSARWEHIDFEKLLPDSHLLHDDLRLRDNISHTTSTASELDDLLSERDPTEPLSKCGVLYSSTSSLSSAATACSPPQQQVSSANVPPSQHTSRIVNFHHQETMEVVEVAKQLTMQQHLHLPSRTQMVSTSGIAATLVSPTIQLLTQSNLRVLPGDAQPLGLTISHRLRESTEIRTTNSITIPTLQLTNKIVGMPANGTIRNAKHQQITLAGGEEADVLTYFTNGAKQIRVPNGMLTSSGMTLTPISGHNLVTPVTVVSQGNQVAHILTSGKVLKSMAMPPLVNGQYLVKPVTVVVSAASSLPHNSTT